MANKSLFASMLGRLPRANAVNEAGGRAYKLEPKHALAQVAATGTFGNAFYSTAETQFDEVLKLIDEVDDNQYLAKLALYAREKAFMKDMPAALLVALSVRDTELMHRVFDRVVDNGRVLRTVFQMIRSGKFKNKAGKGRVGLSSSVQRAFQRWLNTASVGKLLSASIGNDPSLRDILRMARPTPKDNARRAMFGWLTGKEVEKWAPAGGDDLPVEVQALIAYRNSESEEAQALIAAGLDNVRWDLLSDAAKGPKVWAALARKMGPQALRMNLNTLLRHDVLRVAASLRDANVSLGERLASVFVSSRPNAVSCSSRFHRIDKAGYLALLVQGRSGKQRATFAFRQRELGKECRWSFRTDHMSWSECVLLAYDCCLYLVWQFWRLTQYARRIATISPFAFLPSHSKADGGYCYLF